MPEYPLRFDEKTRGLNAITFAAMTVFSSGISMYAGCSRAALGWDFNFSVIMSAVIVLVYIFLGGLTSAIYNEVLQFFLIVFGFVPLVFLGLRDAGGGGALSRALAGVATSQGYAAGADRLVALHGELDGQPDGGRVVRHGHGARLRPLVRLLVHRLPRGPARDGGQLDDGGAAHAADRRRPEDVLPVPRHPAGDDRHRAHAPGGGERVRAPPKADGSLNYDLAIPPMLGHYFPTGVLGLGLTALYGEPMSGMAGNVTAFNTVWTYDIYQSYIRRGASDAHYLWMGRMATIFGIAISVAAAYGDALQQHHGHAPAGLRLRQRAALRDLPARHVLAAGDRHGAFTGLLAGTLAAALHHGLTLPQGAVAGVKGGWFAALHTYPSEMAQNFWTAIYAWTTCFVVTILVSLATKAAARSWSGWSTR